MPFQSTDQTVFIPGLAEKGLNSFCSTLADGKQSTDCDELLICALLLAPCCEYIMMTIAQSTPQ